MKPRVSSRGLPCERLFLDLVELLEGLFREKSLQSLGRGSEMPRDAGSLEQAVRGHGRCCRRRSHKKENTETPRVSVQRSTKSQNSAHTLIASLTECLCLFFLKTFFSVTRNRSSIAIVVDESERARARGALVSVNVATEDEISRRYRA